MEKQTPPRARYTKKGITSLELVTKLTTPPTYRSIWARDRRNGGNFEAIAYTIIGSASGCSVRTAAIRQFSSDVSSEPKADMEFMYPQPFERLLVKTPTAYRVPCFCASRAPVTLERRTFV